MNVVPFPEPEPEKPVLADLFGISSMYVSILGGLTDVFGDMTVEDAFNEIKQMPVRDVLNSVLGIHKNNEGDPA